MGKKLKINKQVGIFILDTWIPFSTILAGHLRDWSFLSLDTQSEYFLKGSITGYENFPEDINGSKIFEYFSLPNAECRIMTIMKIKLKGYWIFWSLFFSFPCEIWAHYSPMFQVRIKVSDFAYQMVIIHLNCHALLFISIIKVRFML